MKIKPIISLFTFVLIFLLYSPIALASNQSPQAPRFNNLGSTHYKISTKVPLAQVFFDQGLVLFYGFEWRESARSFKEAIRLDPECGMCYWGLALALNYTFNVPLTGREYIDAQAAIQKALSLKAYETPQEQDHIKALSLLFQHAPIAADKAPSFSCHASANKPNQPTYEEWVAYLNAMKKFTIKYPNDNDAKAIYAYILFKKIHWRSWDKHRIMNPTTPEIVKTLKSILAKDSLHVGANHYYIHVMEPSPHPEAALESADRLRTLVPGSEHLVHMPAHIYFLTGRYHQATDSSLQAAETFQQYIKTCQDQGFKPEIGYLYLHNYVFIRAMASMEGRKKLALLAAKQELDDPFPEMLQQESYLEGEIPGPYFVKARFGMWNELLNEPMPLSKYRYAVGMWHYARGMAFAHTNHIKEAEKELSALTEITKKKIESRFYPFDLNVILKLSNEVLAAAIAGFQGNEKSTLMHLQLAAKIQNNLEYDEPPPWYFPVKEALGDAYLKWGHPKKAVAMYKQDLKQYPNNGWALYGLAKALRALGKNKEADQVEQQFKEAWKYADIPAPINFFSGD